MEHGEAPNQATVSSKWTARHKSDSKRTIVPPASEDYSRWTVDQLKLECTARKLSVAKNINKDDRIAILQVYGESKGGVALLLSHQQHGKRGVRSKDADDSRRTQHCAFHLVNVLFSDAFFWEFISSGDKLTRRELDEGGSRFWETVAAAFNTSNDTFDNLVSDDSLFTGIKPDLITVHSVAKLKAIWKDVSSAFAKAEAGNKVSGENDDFWNYCRGDKSAMYLHLWCVQRGSGREFCASCVYEENEDDSTKEGMPSTSTPQRNRKRKKSLDPVTALTEAMNKLVEAETSTKKELMEEKTALARVQRERLERDDKTEKLAAIDGILIRQRNALTVDEKQIFDCNVKGMPIAGLKAKKERLRQRIEKIQTKADQLEEEVINS